MINYNPRVINDSLIFYYDAVNTKSFNGSSTDWNDLVKKNNATLTNGAVYSANINYIITDPSSASWNRSSCTVTANQATDSLGNNTLGSFVSTGGNTNHWLYAYTVSAIRVATSHTISGEIKAGTEGYAILTFCTGGITDGFGVLVNLTTKTVSTKTFGTGTCSSVEIIANLNSTYTIKASGIINSSATGGYGLWLSSDASGNISVNASGTFYIGKTTITETSENPGSISFDGINDHVNCGSIAAIGSSLTQFSFSMWVYPTLAASCLLMENGTAHTTNTYYVAQENSTNFSFEVFGTDYDAVYSSSTYAINTWYNLAGTWTASARPNLYLNGVLNNGTRTGVVQSSVINGNTNFFLGSRAGSSLYFSGRIGTSSVYSRVLTATEVSNNFNAVRKRYGI